MYLFQDTSSGDLYALLVCFMYLFQDTSSGDLYALLVCFMFCFRIRVQETRKLCYLILVLILGYELRKFVSLVYGWIVYGLGII